MLIDSGMNCTNVKTIRTPVQTASSKDEDVDLESLIACMSFENDGPDDNHQQLEIFNRNGAADESMSSFENISSHALQDRPASNGKGFLKSLPMAILNRRKVFGSHSDLSSSHRGSTPVSCHFSSSIPQSTQNALLEHRKSPLGERCNRVNTSDQIKWSIWITDLGSFYDLDLPYDATCSLLLHMLLLKLGRAADLTCWAIILQNSDLLLERIVEDHEVLVDVKSHWSPDSLNRLCLSKLPTKFEILQNPETCLPMGILTMPSQSALIVENVESKRFKMQNILTKSAPEFSGWLHVREPGVRFWKKNFCILRNSGLYCSSKGESKEPRHLQCFADVLSSSVWIPVQSKKPDATSFCFCLKGRNSEMKWICADTELERRAWISAIRLIINGNRFYESYVNARRRGATVFSRLNSAMPFSSSENNLVAMDFSGNQGRVISDPSEVAMMELEQQTSWRKKIIRSHGITGSCMADLNGSSAPAQQMAWIARSIHNTQAWFFGKISREDAAELLQRQGLVEGSYLVRDSHRIPGGFVITLCHNQKIKHIPVSQIEIDGQWCFSLDNGDTKFSDLIQLVDFHRLNRGTLPCRLEREISPNYS